MYTNPYLVEQREHYRRQEFLDQAARDHQATQLPTTKQTSSRAINRLKLIAATILIAATLVAVGPRAFTAHRDTVPAVANMCWWIRC